MLIIGISSTAAAIEKLKEEIKRKQAENDIRVNRKIEDLERQNQECKQKKLIKKCNQISKEIRNLQKSRERFKRQSSVILKRYELLNYKDGILFPIIFIFFFLIFAVLEMKCVAPAAIVTSYFFVFLFLLIGFFRIFKCLNIIRDVKVRSKEYEKAGITDVFHKTFNKPDEIDKS